MYAPMDVDTNGPWDPLNLRGLIDYTKQYGYFPGRDILSEYAEDKDSGSPLADHSIDWSGIGDFGAAVPLNSNHLEQGVGYSGEGPWGMTAGNLNPDYSPSPAPLASIDSEVAKAEKILDALRGKTGMERADFLSRCLALSTFFKYKGIPQSTEKSHSCYYTALPSFQNSEKNERQTTNVEDSTIRRRLGQIFGTLDRKSDQKRLLMGYEWDLTKSTIIMRIFTTKDGHQCESLIEQMYMPIKFRIFPTLKVFGTVEDSIAALQRQCEAHGQTPGNNPCVY
ncbi:hypothetical protein BJ085DRAFT_31116 [Dimargaris cristalligena]|uniref:Uncharacterized protein n=1 Tax=Dimargaris cristalligena TaxID=215637 RepID=A0A4P9ZXE0_9FUNG|nr:hypothetical protein BJ085DRAFT_31116 [Dimargaris cristalligena]|eukprot:RKP38323.1 hypothetical protein BJ085DRAFT_31116 [Dimargaris cristalligena]